MIEAREELAPARIVPRPVRSGDVSYILSSWQHSWRCSNTARRLPGSAYHALFADLVTGGVLADDASKLLVCALESDPDEIAAWICYVPGPVPTVHYAFVRQRTRDGRALRRAGLLGALIHLAGVRDALVYTFRPSERAHPRESKTQGVERALLDAARRRGIGAVYRPVEEYLGRTRGRR